MKQKLNLYYATLHKYSDWNDEKDVWDGLLLLRRVIVEMIDESELSQREVSGEREKREIFVFVLSHFEK